MGIATVTLLDDDTEDGVDLELEVYAHYRVNPAEPDVGIRGAWAEVFCVSVITPIGELALNYAERYEDQIMEAAQEDLEYGMHDC